MSKNEQIDSVSMLMKYLKEHDLEAEVLENRRHVKLVYQSGRNEHDLLLRDQIAQKYLDIDFSQYKFFHKYFGILSYKGRFIEAQVGIIGSDFGLFHGIFRSLLERGETDEEDKRKCIRFGEEDEDQVRITIGPASDDFRLMVGANIYYSHARGGPVSRYILYDFLGGPPGGSQRRQRFHPTTLRIENIMIQTYSGAQKALQDISNSCFFHLSRQFDLDLNLVLVPERQTKRRYTRLPEDVLPSPSNKYEPEAMSFYRYGLSAENMPLLQFLAFYQVVEFFFDRYSTLEVRNLVINCLKDPRFSPHKSEFVQELIRIVKGHHASKAARNERDQLSAVFAGTVEPKKVLSWIEAEEDRKKFYSERDLYRKTSDRALDLKNSGNLIPQIVERIYDIRCRIVHSKASGMERDFILPYSEEAIHLSHDIDLMREMAESVLVASSTEMQTDRFDENDN